MEEKTEQTAAFMISEIGKPDSLERRRSDNVLDFIVQPALEAKGYKIIRSDHICKLGEITRQVIDAILEAPFLVADLTNHNPNVFYELAVAHAYAKPVIQMIQYGQELPFDVSMMRCIYFDYADLRSADNAKAEIMKYIDEIVRGEFGDPTPISETYFGKAIRETPSQDNEILVHTYELLRSVSERQIQLEKRVNTLSSSIDQLGVLRGKDGSIHLQPNFEILSEGPSSLERLLRSDHSFTGLDGSSLSKAYGSLHSA